MSSKEQNPGPERPGIGPADSGAVGSHVEPRFATQHAEATPAPIVVQSGMDFDDGLSVADIRRRVGVGMAIVWRYWYAGVIAAVVFAGAFAWFMLRKPIVHEAVTTILAPAANSLGQSATYTWQGFDAGRGQWYFDLPVSGSSVDPEDGTLSGTSLRWTTDRTDMQPALLGTGASTTLKRASHPRRSCSLRKRSAGRHEESRS